MASGRHLEYFSHFKRYLMKFHTTMKDLDGKFKQSLMRHLHYPTGWTQPVGPTVGPTSERLYGQTVESNGWNDS